MFDSMFYSNKPIEQVVKEDIYMFRAGLCSSKLSVSLKSGIVFQQVVVSLMSMIVFQQVVRVTECP